MPEPSDAGKQKMLDALGSNLPGTIIYQLVRQANGEKRLTYISKNIEAFTGASVDEVLKHPELLFDTALEKYIPKIAEAEEKSFHELSIFDVEVECQLKNDDIRWIHIVSTPEKLEDGSVLWIGMQTDITEKKLNELKLSKVNHELTLLNRINDIILNAPDEESLYNNVCRALVVEGNYKLAWVCYSPLPDDPEQKVKPVASYGEQGYVNEIRIDLKDENLRKGPTATVLLHGKTIVTNNFETSDAFKPWLEKTRKFGISASIVLPLNLHNQSRGTINIYAENIDAFDTHEVSVLERLALNLSVAVRNLRIKNEKDKATHNLNERVKELHVIQEVNKTLQQEDENISTLLQQLVQIIPGGWQHKHVCEARIRFDGQVYQSDRFCESEFKQTAIINTQNGKAGSIEVVYTQATPIEDDGPFLLEERNLINTLAEIIEVYFNKKANHEALLTSEANMKSVFDNTEIGYLLLDREYCVISFNQTMLDEYATLSGIKLKKGVNFLELILPERIAYVKNIFEKVIVSESTVEYETYFLVNGVPYYFTINIVPIKRHNVIIGFTLSAYDITIRKLMEMEREKITADLLQRNRDLEQFAYIVSHNLRAPLANILGLSLLLKEEISETDKQHALNGIENSTLRLDEVVRDLNTILQVRREISEVKIRVSFTELVSSIQDSIFNIIEESKTRIETDFSAIDEVTTIRSYLGSIIFNLINNSIKYAQPGVAPHIRIWTERNGHDLMLHFKDNGMGIDLERNGNQLFGLYKRFHPHIEGKGVGLYMVKTQVEVLGGNIEARSEPGKGTEFIIRFTI